MVQTLGRICKQQGSHRLNKNNKECLRIIRNKREWKIPRYNTKEGKGIQHYHVILKAGETAERASMNGR